MTQSSSSSSSASPLGLSGNARGALGEAAAPMALTAKLPALIIEVEYVPQTEDFGSWDFFTHGVDGELSCHFINVERWDR